jgi:hypothetical protein
MSPRLRHAAILPALLLAAATQAGVGITPGANSAPVIPPATPAASCTGLLDNLACHLQWISRVEVRADGELTSHQAALEKTVRDQLKRDLEGVRHEAPDPAALLRAAGGRREADVLKQRSEVSCMLRRLRQHHQPILALACEWSGWGRYGAPQHQRFRYEALYPQPGPPLAAAQAALRDAVTRLVIQLDKARDSQKALRDWR